jgi:MFS transporter, PCFT/HCP family, solute carrier family 46, member 3
VNMCMTLGYPVGSALSGILLRWIGYYGVFAISGSSYLFCLIYGVFYLEEPQKQKNGEKRVCIIRKEY